VGLGRKGFGSSDTIVVGDMGHDGQFSIAGVEHVYSYGNPGNGVTTPAYEADVMEQWLMDEGYLDGWSGGTARGRITDCPMQNQNIHLYGQYCNSEVGFAEIMPGMGILYAWGNLYNSWVDDYDLSVGTGDFTIEMWFRTHDDMVATKYPVQYSNATTGAALSVGLNPVTPSFIIYMKDAVGGEGGGTITPATIVPNDGGVHHLRILFVRASVAALYLDNVYQDIATISGAAGDLSMTSFWHNSLGMTIFEERWSRNISNNSYSVPAAYGYPAYQGQNITSQWLFEDAAGPAIDEIGAVALAVTQVGGSAPNPTYSVTDGSAYSPNIVPGIKISSLNTSNRTALWKADAVGLDPGASSAIGIGGDFVIEWLASYDVVANQTTTTPTVFSTFDDGLTEGIMIGYQAITTTPTVRFLIKSSDGTTWDETYSLEADLFGTGVHKHRVKIDRIFGLAYYVDGISQGTPVNLTTLYDKTIGSNQTVIGGLGSTVTENLDATWYEFRTSKSKTANSGGPLGG